MVPYDDSLPASADDTPREFDSPESQIIDGAEYDSGTRTLKVRLIFSKRSGEIRVYRYGSVPFELWQQFYQATSRGEFFAKNIRPMFQGVLEA